MGRWNSSVPTALGSRLKHHGFQLLKKLTFHITGFPRIETGEFALGQTESAISFHGSSCLLPIKYKYIKIFSAEYCLLRYISKMGPK